MTDQTTNELTDVDPFEDLAYAEVRAELNRQAMLSEDKPKSNFEKVLEFHEATGQTISKWPPTEEEVNLRAKLMSEEHLELEEEMLFYVPDLVEVAKELADVLYVAYGTAVSFGIDIDRVFTEVHKSNMSKLVNGKPLYRRDGKVLKGPNYQLPDLNFLTVEDGKTDV